MVTTLFLSEGVKAMLLNRKDNKEARGIEVNDQDVEKVTVRQNEVPEEYKAEFAEEFTPEEEAKKPTRKNKE